MRDANALRGARGPAWLLAVTTLVVAAAASRCWPGTGRPRYRAGFSGSAGSMG
jgi:hypothetical protein